jgi:hypothetical protein
MAAQSICTSLAAKAFQVLPGAKCHTHCLATQWPSLQQGARMHSHAGALTPSLCAGSGSGIKLLEEQEEPAAAAASAAAAAAQPGGRAEQQAADEGFFDADGEVGTQHAISDVVHTVWALVYSLYGSWADAAMGMVLAWVPQGQHIQHTLLPSVHLQEGLPPAQPYSHVKACHLAACTACRLAACTCS